MTSTTLPKIKSAGTLAQFQLFDALTPKKLSGIRVFDVGQGDCFGVLDENNQVTLYVDYGGLVDHPDKGKRNWPITQSRLNVSYGSHAVPIVLTHWDKDHYYSAEKKNPAAQQCRWLVPTQRVSPQGAKFAANLSNAVRWPEGTKDTVHAFAAGAGHEVRIHKCKPYDRRATAENRNHTGLVVAVVSTAGDGDAILLPGDCAFDRIPHVPKETLRAVVAYHHGSHHDWVSKSTGEAIKNFAVTRSLAYSFGTNTYGHPDRTSYSPNWAPGPGVAVIETPALRAPPSKGFADVVW